MHVCLPTFLLCLISSWGLGGGLLLTLIQDATYGMVSIGPISEEPRKMDLSSRLNTGIEDEIRKQMGLC